MEAVKRWQAKQAAQAEHAGHTSELWRKISFFVCVPAIIVTALWVRKVENEHEEHTEHLKHENGGELPAVPDYEYLNKRSSGPFPWGMNSLFFNPHVQKNMEQQDE
ncbi:cytochrome c oxidase, subunit VIa [Fomitopsis serialis]|uniref:cytochrome c oxidase, subunit VIa n=1 Tax=Fomitopsis serialis TaxID=139415 RepID=UPI0020084CF8|nr:cytochrome c oxidase, subunit VIa [Neoantrodia serialis]KAH9937188.1 cytochrome c oxidase, subunit VIa [Neoantrodia serialis]